VRIEGAAQRVDAEESDDYFAVRPRGAQLGAWASPQSKAVSDRGALERRYAAAAQRFGDGVAVTRPPYWGLSRRAVDGGVLAGAPGPDARPASVPAYRHRLDPRPAGPLTIVDAVSAGRLVRRLTAYTPSTP
jgi:hypothetical protein